MRIDAIDIARGYTVLLMPMVHTVVLFGDESVTNSGLATVLSFFAEETGAPLFMFLMGLSAGLGNKTSSDFFLKRSGRLLALAFALNLLKFVIPYLLNLLPDKLVSDLNITGENPKALQLLLIGDILHLASVSFFVFACCAMAKKYSWIAELLILSLLLFFQCSDVQATAGPPAWIIGTAPAAYFPLLPWLVYPLAGKLLLSICAREDAVRFNWFAILGGTGLIVLIFIFNFSPHQEFADFYKPNTAALLYYSFWAMIWLFVCEQFSTLNRMLLFKQLLRFCSKHITVLYVIQWISIFWSLPFFDYKGEKIMTVLLQGIFFTLLCLLLTLFFNLVFKTFKRTNETAI